MSIRPTRLTGGKNEQQGLDMQEKSAITLACSINDCVCVCVCVLDPSCSRAAQLPSPLTGSHVSRVGLWECEMSLSPWAKDTQPNGRSQSSPNQQSGNGTLHWNYRSWQLSTSIWHVNTLGRCMNVITKWSQEFWPIRDQSADKLKKKSRSLYVWRYVFRGWVHPKNENCRSQPACHAKPVWLFIIIILQMFSFLKSW